MLISNKQYLREVLFIKPETLFLKLAVVLMCFPVLALCIFLVPELGNIAAKLLPEFDLIKYLVSIVFDASAIPFYSAFCIRRLNFYAILTKINISHNYL
jgi:hypothetical protein